MHACKKVIASVIAPVGGRSETAMMKKNERHAPCRVRLTAALALLLAAFLLLSACTGGGSADETTAASGATSAENPFDSSPAPDSLPISTDPETTPETDPGPTIYYMCTDPKDPAGTAFKAFEDLDSAISACDRKKQEGYRVVTNHGETVYLPYTELQCDILRECKRVTDYVREQGFKYGDAPINPAINHRAKKVSCDRFVAWAMYNVGFTDQPRTQGVVVSAMAAWCERNGFERIDREEDLQPGDIVLVKWTGSYPAHTFIYAGESGLTGQPYRYDCGSDTRIQSVQPSREPIVEFWRAYRAVLDTPETEAPETESSRPEGGIGGENEGEEFA